RDSSVWASEFKQVDVFNVERLAIARNHDDDAEPDGSFGGGDDDYEEHKDLAVQPVPDLAEGHEGEVDGVEHQLDGHEDGDDVALENEGDDAEAKEDRAKDYVIVRRDHVRSRSAGRPGRWRQEWRRESGTR